MANIITVNGQTPKVHPSAFVAPNATLIGMVEIGERANIWFGAVLRADQNLPIRIGKKSSIQDNAVLHTSDELGTIIGDSVTIGHCAVLEGCVIGDGALIGMNACVLNGARVEEGALIAAGSVVRENDSVPKAMLAAGVPAQIKKQLDGRALQHVREAADVYYQRLMDLYREGGE